jgi:hypothetical protein
VLFYFSSKKVVFDHAACPQANKYATLHQVQCVERLLTGVPMMLGFEILIFPDAGG